MLRSGDAWIRPVKVEVCKPTGARGGTVNYQRYTTNYGGPLRKADLVSKNAGMQLFATVVTDVCYRLYGEVEGRRDRQGGNPRHHLQDLFNRRLKRGECYRTPSLGWREFTCSYWGPFRNDEYELDKGLELVIPSMLLRVWDSARDGQYRPKFAQNVVIQAGTLTYVE
jgi:CRISPR-associated protein Cas5d